MTDWPWGKRAVLDEHGIVEILDDDHPVDYWVCLRLDEPWTWTSKTNQYLGACARCQGAIVYRVSERTPTNPAVKKICRRCAERLVAEEAAESRTR